MRRLLAIGALFALTGCLQTTSEGWYKIDGAPAAQQQLAVDQTICRGEVQKANLANPEGTISVSKTLQEQDAFDGCMAQRGYLHR